MLEGIIFQDGAIFENIENTFAWFKQWASQNKINFKAKNSESFKVQMDNFFRDGFKMKKFYESFNLPFVENEVFLKEYNGFQEGRSSRFYGEMASIIKESFIDGKDLMKTKGSRLRVGINSFHSYSNITSALKVGCVLKNIDSIMSQEWLVGNNSEKDYFSLEKTLPRLVFQGLKVNPKNILYVTNHPSSLKVAKKLKQGARKGSLICIGAPWAGSRGNFESGHRLESGEILKFDYIPNTPYELKKLIRELL